VQGENAERWRELCALATTEQDPDRLLALIREINMLLERKERRLKSEAKATHIKRLPGCTCAGRTAAEG